MLFLKVLLACLLENKDPVLRNYNWTLCMVLGSITYYQARTHHCTTNSYLAHRMVICPTHHMAHKLNTVVCFRIRITRM